MDPANLLVEHLSRIEGLIRALCRRHGYQGAAAEDFAGWVKERLVEDDYRILRKFQGRSLLTTYLATVIANLARDYRIRNEGRWRPSAVAKRLGPVGVRLDTLVHRDGLPHAEAVRRVRSELPEAPPASDLHRMIAELPQRLRPRHVGDEALAAVEGPFAADRSSEESDRAAHATRVMGALEDAIRGLPREDQVILRLRFEQGMTTADVARTLGLDQKPLYRRVEGLLEDLRQAFEVRGIGAADVAELLANHAEAGASPPGIAWEVEGDAPDAGSPTRREA